MKSSILKTLKSVFIFSFTMMILASCNYGGKNRANYLPNINGKSGDVLVVIEKNNWESEPGIEIRSILAQEFPFLPQREPMFTLYNVNHNTFSGTFMLHRNIVIINIGAAFDSSRIAYQEDVWAAPQVVITVSAPNKEDAVAIMEKEKIIIMNSIEQAERNRIIRNAKAYPEVNLREVVQKQIGGSPYFPKGYSMKKRTHDFIWISYETTYVNQGIFIYTYPYNPSNPITLQSIIEKRNKFLEANVPGSRDNSFMVTSTLVEPGLQWMKYKNREFAEVRGLWELQNDYMGGPFVCHTFFDKENQNIIVLEGFVYAPKFDKRNYLRNVESIIYSFDWKEVKTTK